MHLISLSKAAFKALLKNSSLSYCYVKSPVGFMRASVCEIGLVALEFVDSIPTDVIPDDLESIKNIVRTIVLIGTDFQCAVWRATLQIPTGTTQTYQEIAQRIDNPKAYRAVGLALKNNRIAYLIPCHRVVGQQGALTGYRWGVEKKHALLLQESLTD